MSEPSFARPVRDDDHSAIDDLLVLAFGGPTEARLVRDLRAGGHLYKEVVMPLDDHAAGYLAISRLPKPDGWFALGPVAIHPNWQAQGRGRFIVKNEVEELVHRGGKSIVVLGDVGFYRSAGFSHVRARRLKTPYSRENILLAAPGADVPQQEVFYPRPFRTA